MSLYSKVNNGNNTAPQGTTYGAISSQSNSRDVEGANGMHDDDNQNDTDDASFDHFVQLDRRGSSMKEIVHDLLDASMTFSNSGEACDLREIGGHATVASEVANMSKSIIGCGVMSLPGGMAMYANSPSAIRPACLWIAILGTAFGYFCVLIARVCQMTNSATYREAWTKSCGSRGALVISMAQATKPGLANLAYASILSQTGVSLLETMNIHIARVYVLWILTLIALLPLCLLKSLHVLAPFSVLGTTGIFYTAFAMLVRYLDRSYQEGGYYYSDVEKEYRPVFGTTNEPWSLAILPFVCMVFESYIMHYNSPRFYMELLNPTIPRFAKASGFAFGISATSFMFISSVGFLTFGVSSSTFILNNYSPEDPLMTTSRLALFLAILLTYPLAFVGFRDGIIDCLDWTAEKQTGGNINLLSVVLLAILTIVATFVTDLGIINAVGGGTLAAALCFVFPALMFDQATLKLRNERTLECYIALAIMVVGGTLGIAGVIIAVRAQR